MKNKVIILMFSILLFLSLVACNKKIENEYEILKLNLTMKEQEEDYEFFWDFINEGFPFLEELQDTGVDLEKIKKEEFDRLKNSNFSTKAEYLTFYGELCAKITNNKPIGHLRAISYELYNKIYKNFYPARNIFFVKNKKIENFYAARPSGSWDKTIWDNVQNISGVITNIIKEGEIACIRIDSFLLFDDEFDKYLEQIDSFLKKTENYKHIIIDITRNGGGATKVWEHLVSRLIKNDINYNRYALYKKTKYNRYHLNMSFLANSIKKIDIQSVPNYKNIKTKRFNKACVENEFIYKKPFDNYNYDIDKKIWLLVSQKCYSASDRFAGFCKATNFATVIGERTSGCGMNIDMPRTLALPNSGALFLYEYTYSLNPDGSCNAVLGVQPDVYSKDGKTPMQTCIEEIKKYDEQNQE